MSQYGACTHCGSNLTPEDFQKPACRYCGTAFLHHQEAAAKVAELHAVMGMMRPPMPPGVAPVPGQFVVVPGMAPVQHPAAGWAGAGPPLGASPPPGGGPMPAAPPPGRPMPASPDAAIKIVMLVVGITLGVTVLLVIAGAVAGFVLAR